jgi:hypothetical protein
MKGDIQEAMAQAVQSSDVIVVLVSLGYKESANCRLECQYAMKQNKPLLFLVCEQSYTSPTGWLGLIMGQKMWVGVFTPTMVENKSDEVMRRLDEVLKGENDVVTTTTTTTTTATTSTSADGTTTTTSPHHHGTTISEMISNLVKTVAMLEEKTTHLEAKTVAQESEIATLKEKVATLENQVNKEG